MARRKDRPGPLEPRSAAILRAIIEEYVATAQPVGSQALVEKYGLGVSPATVRNVMAELERPRAARPSAHERGSRAHRPGLPPVRRVDRGRRRAGARRAAHDPPPVRPGRVRQRAVVPARRRDARLRRPTSRASRRRPSRPRAASAASTSCAGGHRMASLVVVLAEGPVKQVLLATEHPYSDERARGRCRATLAQLLAGRSAQGAANVLAELGVAAAAGGPGPACARPPSASSASCATSTRPRSRTSSARASSTSWSARVRAVGDAPARLRRAPGPGLPRGPHAAAHARSARCASSSAPRTTTGDARRLARPGALRPGGRAIGVVGVLGPTRMAYPHAISTVRYVSGLMNELVDHLYA